MNNEARAVNTNPTPVSPQYVRPIVTTPRVGVIVWGVIVTAIGLTIMGVALRRQSMEVELLAIVVLFAAGAALLATAIIGAIRGRRRRRSLPHENDGNGGQELP
ncbi:MAG: hypothetical protein LBJ08_10850 [Bifidobacteriaceae bacterium]|jgi:hypothetical protein|nr:hypothetical protein [Bifidobacteriaceae bacterium]